MMVCLEGVIGIVQGEHPASIDEKLKAFVSPSCGVTRKPPEARGHGDPHTASRRQDRAPEWLLLSPT